MATAGIKGYAYCLNHAPETGFHYGNTPFIERETKGEAEFLRDLPSFMQKYEEARDYAPNLAYIGGMTLEAWKTPRSPGTATGSPDRAAMELTEKSCRRTSSSG